jgi:SMC interacting uncharacterized protein involved in chromosome segregation
MDSTISLSTRSLQFYVIAKRWLADVEFFKFETDFLDRFLKTYYSTDLVHIDKDMFAEKLLALARIKNSEAEIETLLTDQIRHLELMADDIIPEDTQELSVNQVKLEQLLKTLTNDFRQLKKEVYHVAEQLLLEYKRMAF